MGIFFRKKKEEEDVEQSTLLDIENAAFNTVVPSEPTREDNSYQDYVYNPPKIDVPTYKARNTRDLGVVIDSEQLGFNKGDLNANLKTIEFETGDNEEISLPVDEIERKEEITPIEEQPLDIEVVDLDYSEPVAVNFSTDLSFNNEEVEKFNIFGSEDGPSEAKSYSAQDYQEKPVELIQEVKYTEDGYKICPDCGAILNANALVCFMCSKSFVLKR